MAISKVISSPLVIMPSTIRPLRLSILLNDSIASLLPLNTNNYSEEMFDDLDNTREDLTVIELEDELEEGKSILEVEEVIEKNELNSVLSDKLDVLFPYLMESEQEYDTPNWLKQSSSKITALIGTNLSIPIEIKGGFLEGDVDKSKKKTTTLTRVVVGCEDGSIWLFSPTETNNSSTTNSAEEENNNFERPTPSPSPSNSTSAFNSYNISTLPTPSPSSPGTPKSPLLPSTPSYSNSDSPPPSPTFTSRSRSATTNGRSSHLKIRPTSPSTSTYSNRHHSSDTLSLNTNPDFSATSIIRPRKASATVSVSTTTGEDSTNGGGTFSFDQAQSSSPTLPTLVLPKASSTRKERHKPRKSSVVTVGIGLWEQNDRNQSIEDLNLNLSNVEEIVNEEFIEEIIMNNLEPRLKVIVGGEGSIIGLKVMEGSRFGIGEGGKVFVCLRSSGLLSIHSFIDGRSVGSIDIASKTNTSKVGPLNYTSLEILDSPSSKVAVCYGNKNTGLISIDLNSLEVLETIENFDSSVGLISFSLEGISSIAYITSLESSPHLLSRSLSTRTEVIKPETKATNEAKTNSIIETRFEDSIDLGTLPGLSNDIKGLVKCGKNMIAFDQEGILLFTIRNSSILSLGFVGVSSILNVVVDENQNVMVVASSETSQYKLKSNDDSDIYHFLHIQNFTTSDLEFSTFFSLSSTASCYLLSRSNDTTRYMECVTIDSTKEDLPKIVLLYEVPRKIRNSKSQVTGIVSIDIENAIIGLNTGAIYEASYSNLFDLTTSTAKAHLGGPISLLEVIEMGSKKVIIAGSSNGEAGAWYLPEWECIQTWKLFASPVSHLVQFKVKSSNQRMSNTIALISSNSPIAIISLFPPSLLFIIPGTNSNVRSIATNGEDLLVIYLNGLARIWDVDAGELRRSMDLKTALSVSSEKGWRTWFSLNDRLSFERTRTSSYNPTLTIDLRSTIDTASKMVPWSETKKSKKGLVSKETFDLTADTKNSKSHLTQVKFLLSHLLSFGLDSDCDKAVNEHLEISKPIESCASAVLSTSSSSYSVTKNPWTISSVATAQRLLQIVCLLRVFLNFPDTERYASEAIVFYASFLSASVGNSFIAPALDVFADYWLDVSTEVQQAARLLFGTYLVSSSDGYMLSLVERWQELLPSRQIESIHCESADQAVLVIGLLAAEKFKLLSTATLKDVSTSIISYLEKDDHPYHQAIATELCTRGFEIWQNYVDAMKLVRLLFGLATGRNINTPLEVKNLAKLATLHVAAVNTPLFMTTLSFDILNSVEAVHRKATLKLLGFMVRKKPLVLYTSLPKLAEAVVKSLDPSVTSLRETVHEAATVILNELVSTYPSIDFHHSSQRLAVGTPEGATIVYDLRTGTRLFVLEGHTKGITALSFSPDGRRLVSVSLEESKVLVWRIGVGLLSMFAGGLGVGGEGRGSEGKVPWKVLDFNVGDEGLMTTAATLEWVTFEWPAERTTRLKIRESNLTFSV